MDFCRNISVSGGLPANHPPEQQLLSPSSCSKLCSLDDLFSGHSMEEGDINMEWLSIFVEDCLSSSGTCLPPTPKPQSTTSNAQSTTSSTQDTNPREPHNLFTLKPPVPCKARSKRKRNPSCWSRLYPPLQKCTSHNSSSCSGQEEGGSGQGQIRRCTHCLSQRTPQWRAGPLGPKTLCNACGVRYKSGRLLPEYRPAKSPTFVSYKHSNSHKKVLEMRMTILPSSSTNSSCSS